MNLSYRCLQIQKLIYKLWSHLHLNKLSLICNMWVNKFLNLKVIKNAKFKSNLKVIKITFILGISVEWLKDFQNNDWIRRDLLFSTQKSNFTNFRKPNTEKNKWHHVRTIFAALSASYGKLLGTCSDWFIALFVSIAISRRSYWARSIRAKILDSIFRMSEVLNGTVSSPSVNRIDFAFANSISRGILSSAKWLISKSKKTQAFKGYFDKENLFAFDAQD